MFLRARTYVNTFFLSLFFATLISAQNISDGSDYKLVVNRVLKQCALDVNKYSCIANKAAIVMERAVDWDIPLFDGFSFVKNEAFIDNSTSRSFSDGVSRLSSAVSKFLDSHTITLDLTKEEARGARRGGGKKGKKERKYLQYALMVLLGVFGISGPLIMNALGLFAGKALIASKIALIIVGSVALKKIFDKDKSHSSVKVHTHTVHDSHDEDYDRHIDAGAYKFLNNMQHNVHKPY